MLTAADIIEFGLMTGPSNETAGEGADRIAGALDKAGLLAPAPQIVRTPAELEALDPDTLLVTVEPVGHGSLGRSAEYISMIYYPQTNQWPLPAVVVASGEYLRACREALEGETGKACGG